MRNDPTGRALQLLSLLQTQRFWPCAELAGRLEVAERTVRRDVERLRDLGYAIDTTTGKYGGYRLASGAHLPPLVLDDEEAVAIAVGLRYAARAAIDGIEETSLRALTKIEALLPHRLRRRVSALHTSVTSARRTDEDDLVHPETLSVLAAACRDRERVRFEYRRDDQAHRRSVEPHELVTSGRRWYLVAWDLDRDDWRTFRLDRVRTPRAVSTHFTPREIPGADAAAFVAAALGSSLRQYGATLSIDAPLADLEPDLHWIDHTVVTSTAVRCVILVRGEDPARLALSIARIALSAPVSVVDPGEVGDTVGRLSHHLSGAHA